MSELQPRLSPAENEPQAYKAYLVAVAAAAASVGLDWILQPWIGPQWPYSLSALAVIVAARQGGRGPGLLATAITTAAFWFTFATQSVTPTAPASGNVARLVVFAIVGVGISLIGGELHAALQEARAELHRRTATEADLRRHATLLSAVTETAPDCIFLKDRQNRFVMVNPAALKLFAKPKEEVLGKSEADCFSNREQGRKIVEADSLTMERGEVSLLEETVDSPDGARTFLTLKTPWRDAAGNVIGLAGVARDITERKRAQLELQRQAELIHNAHDAIIVADADRLIRVWNRGAQTMYGFDQTQAIGKIMHELLRSEGPVSIARIDKELVEKGRWEGELVHTRADGARATVESRQVLLRDSSGAPVSILEVNRDITERKRVEADLIESRKRLQVALEAAQLGTWEMTLDGRRITASERTAALFGFDQAPGDPETWFERVHAGDREVVSRLLDESARGLACFDVEFRTDVAGVVRWVVSKGEIIAGSGGDPASLIGVVQDITRRKEAEEVVRKSEQLFRSIAEGIPSLVCTARGDGSFEYVNSRTYEYTGRTEDDFANGNWSIWDSVHPADSRRARRLWEVSIATHQPFHVESRLRNALSEYRWFLWHAVPVAHGDSNAMQWFCTLTDIHDRKTVEQQVNALNADLEERVRARTAQLEAANHELEAFAYSVSHDLRAPLRGIDGWSLALLEDYGGQVDATGRQYLDRVRSETQRMGLLIDDLLQLSRITRVEMRQEPVDLSELAQSIAARLREAEPARDFDFAIEPGMTAIGDARLIEVALTNLLSNAAKFTGPQQKPRIEVGRLVENDETVFYVRDNGVGFDMAHAGMLFNAFQRLHRTSAFPGTGIGLAIVHRVVQRHGGRVWADSRPGEGAVFNFVLGPQTLSTS